ncbi:MAG TPA: geranylgeranylglycerol-phosphate geranylgeranyltransferase [Flavobacteriaceae bacterium]|nr:geranylgeranylglycerol-phosphate geranylgeranyltransferase [Flavobacteriaceae bacterium]
MDYLKLIGYKTLLMIAATQILIKYFLFEPFDIAVSLNEIGFFLLLFASLCLAAAGNCILEISNREADLVNQPEKVIVGNSISEKFAFNMFIGLNIVAVVIGFFLSNAIGHPGFSALFIIVSALLYLYPTFLKKQLIMGNMFVGILAALTIILLGLYDLLPAITPENQNTQHTVFSILLDYAVFAFLVVWLREMVNDQKNMDGDHKAGNASLTLSFGKERTNTIIFIFTLVPLASLLYYMYSYLYGNQTLLIYLLAFLVGPLLYFLIKILSAKHAKHYVHLRRVLSFVMWAGIVSFALYKFLLM